MLHENVCVAASACMHACVYIYWHENSSKANQYRLADISIRQADIRHLINLTSLSPQAFKTFCNTNYQLLHFNFGKW